MDGRKIKEKEAFTSMQYFIDFEATQYSMEIISVGCVDENGRTFSTLIRPHNMNKMSDFITELTGITREQLQDAPSADEAFDAFYDWLDDSESAQFFCYGDCDRLFVYRTLRYVDSFRAQCALGLILSKLTDASLITRRYFRIDNTLSLKHAVAYFAGELPPVSHEALADAESLRFVYEHVKTGTVDVCPFPEYVTVKKVKPKAAPPKVDAQRQIVARNGDKQMEFTSFSQAADWVMRTYLKHSPSSNEMTKYKVEHRIRKAATQKKNYQGCKWSCK